MATYLIGDVQGCYDDLMRLLDHIQYDATRDRLGFVGDLINRGPKSLETLRFISQLKHPLVVLGNHDVYAMMLGYGCVHYGGKHTLDALFDAPDCVTLLDWLRAQPFLVHDEGHNVVVTHAGIPPCWDLETAKACAHALHAALNADDFKQTLAVMFGDEPAAWSTALSGVARLRYTMNALTRMRFCQADGTLDFSKHGDVETPPPHCKAWFQWPSQWEETDIVFGHWAMLRGVTDVSGVYGIDTGCVWGEVLTALRLEDRQLFSVSA